MVGIPVLLKKNDHFFSFIRKILRFSKKKSGFKRNSFPIPRNTVRGNWTTHLCIGYFKKWNITKLVNMKVKHSVCVHNKLKKTHTSSLLVNNM